MIKKIVTLFLFFLFAFANNASATHLMGGEITWDCQGSGQYVFTLKLYRDCNGTIPPGLLALNVFNHPTVSTINVNLVSQTDISPSCNGAGPAISCTLAETQPGWPSSGTPILGAVKEYVYQSAAITLAGVPPAQGWSFIYSECCRNASISNLQSPGSNGITLRAVMYAYSGQNASPCFDSSPKFLESPSTIICVGYPFSYNHNAYDPDLDSLNYSFAEPLTNYVSGAYNPPVNPAPINFTTGYSYLSPLPGTTQNAANVPAVINNKTGEITFTSFTQGNFVTVIKVQAYKCGQLVAEVYREIQVVLLPCAANNPPAVTYTTYQDTVYAGTNVNFTLTASDNGTLPGGAPQTISIGATGTQFGAGYTNAASGCLNPPCATLAPVPPASGTVSTSTVFNWQTSCNHLNNSSCNSQSNTYTFVFKVKDDFCPAPAENISTVSITVLALPVMQSPQPRCVAVLPNGDVTLTWSTPPDPGATFNSYHIYTANALAGPYTLLDSIFSYTQITYTHVGANANTASRFYYIKTRSGCGGMIYANAVDTVRSMLLNVNNPSNGTAQLSWNPIATPNISSSSGVYTIYQEYPAGVWTVTGTTTNLSFIDSIFICNGSINYRIEIADNTGCTSVSSVAGSLFQNIIVPAIPVFDTLSVDDNNNALMNWNVNPSPDVTAYVVYFFNGSVWLPLDTLFGINNTNFTNLLSNADLASEQYRVAAIDSCNNISPMSGAFSTIYLQAITDICNRSAILNWNPYPTIGTGLAGYRVYVSTTSLTGPYSLLATVAAGTTTYTAAALAPNTMYYFKVQAFDNSGTRTASSNRINFYSPTPVPPNYAYLRKASVINDAYVEITAHVDTAASTLKYKIMRSMDNATFSQVGVVNTVGVTPIVFNDATAKVDKQSYFYKVINVDSCGFDGMETNIGHTILLKAISDSDVMTNTLTWNDYAVWSGNVMSYRIYRGIDGVMDPTPIATVPFINAGENTFTDDISMELQGQGIFNYYIQAVEGMGNIYGFSDDATSNIAEAYQDPIIHIPNAFKPSGVNSIFIPVTTYASLDGYQFMVFNRWGLKVFETSNLHEGWDGTAPGGKKAELGVYVYLVRYKNSKGEYFELKGSVTLIR